MLSARRTGPQKSDLLRASAIFEAVDKCKCLDSLCMVKQFLEFVIRQLVEFPDEVMLSEIPSGRTTLFRVQMRQTECRETIDETARRSRLIARFLSSLGSANDQRATLEIVRIIVDAVAAVYDRRVVLGPARWLLSLGGHRPPLQARRLPAVGRRRLLVVSQRRDLAADRISRLTLRAAPSRSPASVCGLACASSL